MAPKISVSEVAAVYNCAEDVITFCLLPEMFPVFWAWMEKQGKIKPDYSTSDMQEDMEMILFAIQARPRMRRDHP